MSRGQVTLRGSLELSGCDRVEARCSGRSQTDQQSSAVESDGGSAGRLNGRPCVHASKSAEWDAIAFQRSIFPLTDKVMVANTAQGRRFPIKDVVENLPKT